MSEFDAHVLCLLEITSKARPERVAANTAVNVSSLMQLGCFLSDVADAVRHDAATSAEAMKAGHEAAE